MVGVRAIRAGGVCAVRAGGAARGAESFVRARLTPRAVRR